MIATSITPKTFNAASNIFSLLLWILIPAFFPFCLIAVAFFISIPPYQSAVSVRRLLTLLAATTKISAITASKRPAAVATP